MEQDQMMPQDEDTGRPREHDTETRHPWTSHEPAFHWLCGAVHAPGACAPAWAPRDEDTEPEPEMLVAVLREIAPDTPVTLETPAWAIELRYRVAELFAGFAEDGAAERPALANAQRIALRELFDTPAWAIELPEDYWQEMGQ